MGKIKLMILSLMLVNFCNAQFSYGYNKTGKFDTVKAILLVTECDTCNVKSIPAFAVREQYTYYGDKMPTYPPTDYSDYWSVISFLDNKKRTFPSNVIIWDSRLILNKTGQ